MTCRAWCGESHVRRPQPLLIHVLNAHQSCNQNNFLLNVQLSIEWMVMLVEQSPKTVHKNSARVTFCLSLAFVQLFLVRSLSKFNLVVYYLLCMTHLHFFVSMLSIVQVKLRSVVIEVFGNSIDGLPILWLLNLLGNCC